MASLEYDVDFPDLKMRRAEERATTISKKAKKRAKFERGTEAQEASVRSARAPRIARVAIRTCLAKGLLGASADMPNVSMHRGSTRHRGIPGRRAKASVPSVLVFQPAQDTGEEGKFAFDDLCNAVSAEACVTTQDAEVDVTEQAKGSNTEELSKSHGLESATATVGQDKDPAVLREATVVVSVLPPTRPAEAPDAQATLVDPALCRMREAIAQERTCEELGAIYKDCLVSSEKPSLREESSAWRPLFSMCSTVGEILDEMSADCASPVLQIVGFLALEAATTRGACGASELNERRTLQVLVSAMEEHYQSETLQALGCKLLQTAATSRSADSQARLAQCRGAQALLTALIAHRSSASLQEAACLALSQFAARDSSIQEDISSSGGLEAVLEAMALHTDSASLQVAGCAVIRHMSTGSSQHQGKIASLGGVQLVLTALDLYVDVAAVQWAGCWALFCLTWQNNSLKGHVAASGGAGAVLRAMDAHQAVLKVQEAGCWALSAGAVADDASAELSDCVQVVSRAMTLHPVEEVLKVGRVTLQRLIATGVSCPNKNVRGLRTSIVKPSIVKRRHPLGAKGCLPAIAE